MLKLKHSVLFRQKGGDDVGFPSVCYEYVLLPLVNKEVSLAYDRAGCSKVRNSSRDRGGKEAESGRCHVAAQEARGNKP